MAYQKLIHCGRLYDGIHDDLQEKMDILVEGESAFRRSEEA